MIYCAICRKEIKEKEGDGIDDAVFKVEVGYQYHLGVKKKYAYAKLLSGECVCGECTGSFIEWMQNRMPKEGEKTPVEYDDD